MLRICFFSFCVDAVVDVLFVERVLESEGSARDDGMFGEIVYGSERCEQDGLSI